MHHHHHVSVSDMSSPEPEPEPEMMTAECTFNCFFSVNKLLITPLVCGILVLVLVPGPVSVSSLVSSSGVLNHGR